MHVGSILIFIGWFIRDSYQLSCIQCTSSIRRVKQTSDHSCLDGTLEPVLCIKPINETKSYKNCVSALYRFAVTGVHIHRGCSMIKDVRHECDPPISTVDLHSTFDFFCSRTCSYDGCNQHLVGEISSNANEFLYKTKILLSIFFLIWIQIFLLC